MSETAQDPIEQRDEWTVGPRDIHRALQGETVRITTPKSDRCIIIEAEEVDESNVR